MGEFITCGTMASKRPVKRPISKEKSSKNVTITDLERQIINNEYLKILKDPRFSDLNVNFMEM